jgi:TctA family transporter
MIANLAAAAAELFSPHVLLVILGSSIFGLFIGAIPGLTATMATALLVPVTFYMAPVPAVAAMVSASAMAMFAGAYTDDAYALTKKGMAHVSLGICLLTSALGGIFGAIILSIFAPQLATVALKFSSYEYFWLCLLGLTTSAFIIQGSTVKGIVSLSLGLFVATVGIDPVGGVPRFTFGSTTLIGGISLVPVMIGVFAIAEVLRFYAHGNKALHIEQVEVRNVFAGQAGILWKERKAILQGNVLGTLIGILPGAGADIAAWISYSVAKRFSRNPQQYGKGSTEGLAAAGAANNAAVSGAYVPALVFGIPGDAITAIVIGVLFMKGVNPGPMIFVNNPATVYGIFMAFILANLLMIPLGWAAIRGGQFLLRAKLSVLMPFILICCLVGAFAVDNTIGAVAVALAFGVVGYVMEENGLPLAPFVLGIVLGPLVEQNFLTSMMKSGGEISAFFARPIAASLAIATILIWLSPAIFVVRLRRLRRSENGSSGKSL